MHPDPRMPDSGSTTSAMDADPRLQPMEMHAMATKKPSSKKGSDKEAAKPETAKPAKPAKTEDRQPAAKPAEKKTPAKAKPAGGETQPSAAPAAALRKTGPSATNLLERAEADMTKLLESLNTQMAAAMQTFAELAAAQRGKHEAVIRTKPLDRATAMFQRLVTELLDERMDEILPTIVALRVEMSQRARMGEGTPEAETQNEFLTRGTEMLDQVLANVDVHTYQPQVGDAFDPLIHLAVGETTRTDLAGDVVSDVFQAGFRSARGKVIHAARVKVNRR
jgi:molecular chaperone GrpE (heat shock protein)